MASKVQPIPEGYHTLTPFLTVHGAAQLIEFLVQAFDAQVKDQSTRPDGTVWHADLVIGDSHLMVAEATEQWKAKPSGLYVYVPDTDATYRRALQAGAKSLMEPADQFYGDRNAGVEDASGNSWWISTHIEDVPPEEMERRAEAAKQKMQA